MLCGYVFFSNNLLFSFSPLSLKQSDSLGASRQFILVKLTLLKQAIYSCKAYVAKADSLFL